MKCINMASRRSQTHETQTEVIQSAKADTTDPCATSPHSGGPGGAAAAGKGTR